MHASASRLFAVATLTLALAACSGGQGATPPATSPPVVAAPTARPTAEPTVAPRPTRAPRPTAEPTAVSEIETQAVEFGDLQTYEHDSGVFAIDIPEKWGLTDNSSESEIIHVWSDPTRNAAVIVDIFEDETSYSADELTDVLTTFLKDQFGNEEDFSTDDPKTQPDDSILVVWSYTATADNNTPVVLLGNSFIEQRENKISILTTLVPQEQFESTSEFTNQIINSYQIDPSSAIRPEPTPEAGEALPVEFSDLQTYEHNSGVFAIDIPEKWSLTDNSSESEIIHVWSDPTRNAAVIVDIFEDETSYSADELTDVLTTFLKSQFGDEEDFSTDDPKTQSDDSILVVWSYTATADNNTPVVLLGNSFIEQRENKISILTTLVPQEQFESTSEFTNQIINSYQIDPGATLSTGA